MLALAWQFGFCDVDYMLRTVSSRQIAEWVAFLRRRAQQENGAAAESAAAQELQRRAAEGLAALRKGRGR